MSSDISDKKLQYLRRWYSNYVDSYKVYSDDVELQENVELKDLHTANVCKEILELGKSLKLTQKQLCIAEIIALFHDIGRFEQYRKYRTFSDGRSVNHGEYGIKILGENDILDILNPNDKSLVVDAVKYHNSAAIPTELSEEKKLFLKLIRDADKLDIFRVVTDYYKEMLKGKRSKGIELNLPDTNDISEKVSTSIKNKTIVNIVDLRNLNDFKLLQAAWVFDINFKHSLSKLMDKKYLDIIKQSLPENETVEEIFYLIENYMNEKYKAQEIRF